MENNNMPTYAKICGVLALIFSILSVLVPVIGTLFITPLAIIFTFFALWGGSKSMGVACIIIIIINLMISPTFWANIYAGAAEAGAVTNRYLTYFDSFGVVLLFVALIFGRKK